LRGRLHDEGKEKKREEGKIKEGKDGK